MNYLVTLLGLDITKEVYKDLLQPSCRVLGNYFKKKLKEKLRSIPEKNKQQPKLKILVPTIQALAYNVDEKEIREMFINLLTNSADNRKKVDSSFIEILKQMDELDAKLFKKIFSEHKNIVANIILLDTENKGKFIPNEYLPEWFLGNNFTIEGYDIFDISVSLTKLKKLGLIDIIERQGWVSGDDLMKDEEIEILYNNLNLQTNLKNIKIECWNNNSLKINDYGKHFARICL